MAIWECQELPSGKLQTKQFNFICSVQFYLILILLILYGVFGYCALLIYLIVPVNNPIKLSAHEKYVVCTV